VLRTGSDATLVGFSWTTRLSLQAADVLSAEHGVECDVVDLRVLNPFSPAPVLESVAKTGRLVVTEGDWRNCGVAAEVITNVVEHLGPSALRSAPRRVNLVEAPAPTSKPLEAVYYPTVDSVVQSVLATLA
jgi:pyruvate dehydrogenase E1 component beta subunit